MSRLAALDVDYRADCAVVACVTFADWAAPTPTATWTRRSDAPPQEYEPGAFYKRELPYLLDLLAEVQRSEAPPEVLIVDGHVWLGPHRPGLGWRLHEATGREVVGVAKQAFFGSPALPVLRGESRQPLWVTTTGPDVQQAARRVQAMHGAWRVPTLLKLADGLARGLVTPAPPAPDHR